MKKIILVFLISVCIISACSPSNKTPFEITWDALGGSKGPGYANLEIFSYEGDKSFYPGILVTFQVELDTTKEPFLCQGLAQIYYGDPGYTNIDWQNEKCAMQHQITSFAHFTLNNDGNHAVLQKEFMYPASSLLMAWINSGKINLNKIQNPKMRDMVYSRIHSDPMTNLSKLDGTRWVLQTLNAHELQDNTIITLEFNSNNISGRGGCNRYSANYVIQPDYNFKVSEGGSTEMACLEPEGLMEQESEYTNSFWNVTNYYIMEEVTLFLANEQEGTLLVYKRYYEFDVQPENLMGKTWQLVSLGGLQGINVSDFTLQFDETKSILRGTTSCRHFEGMYYAENDILRILSLSMGSTMTCSNEDSEAEANYISLLNTIWQYNIIETQLQLNTEFGIQMVFELVPQNSYP